MPLDGDQPGRPPPHWSITFAVDDADAAAAKAAELGGTVLMPPMDAAVRPDDGPARSAGSRVHRQQVHAARLDVIVLCDNCRPCPEATETGAFVVAADLALEDGVDPASVGAAVTMEPRGDWAARPCRWPHNNEIEVGRAAARFGTLFVADQYEEPAIRTRIEDALAADRAGACSR